MHWDLWEACPEVTGLPANILPLWEILDLHACPWFAVAASSKILSFAQDSYISMHRAGPKLHWARPRLFILSNTVIKPGNGQARELDSECAAST